MNAGQALDATVFGVYQALWEDGFSDLEYRVLEAAFGKTLRTCKFWPVKVADVREHIDRTRETAVIAAADLEWQTLHKYIREWVSPDMVFKNHRAGCPRRGCTCPGPPQLSERVSRAARASGGLHYLQNCSHEDLQWAKKRFVESYLAWDELELDQYLLPDGELKNLLARVAQTKVLPPP
jgi:hypothetical protein